MKVIQLKCPVCKNGNLKLIQEALMERDIYYEQTASSDSFVNHLADLSLKNKEKVVCRSCKSDSNENEFLDRILKSLDKEEISIVRNIFLNEVK